MTSSTSQASSTRQSPTSEGTGSSAPESTYRYGRFYRSPVFAQLAAAAPLAAVALWMAFSGAGPLEWLSAAGFLMIALPAARQSAGTLLSVFRLTEDRIWQQRPLHADKDIPLGEVRRMFIGGHSVELYASPGPEPDLEFERGLEGGDELVEKLARRLPAGAEVEHPSGELAERLSEVSASASGQRPDGAGITDPADTLGEHRSDNEGAAENR
jgi:hypothetical protein